MKAIVFTKYGPPDVLQLQETERPSPKENEVLIKVHATSVNAMEWRPFTMPRVFLQLIGGGIHQPRDTSVGVDVAGRVAAAGAGVTRFRPGDEVFGLAKGAFAEYACTTEDRLTLKPAQLSFEEAAAVPLAALTALQGLRDKGNIQAGQTVLIHGAGGGVGTFAVQIAKAFGADVTALCSTANVEMVRAIGADRVIDYTREDFTAGGRRFDLIVVANGDRPVSHYLRALKPKGTCVVIGGSMRRFLQGLVLRPVLSRVTGKRVAFMLTRPTHQDLVLLKELLEAGKIVPVIDRRFALADTAEAVRYLMGGHARGKVVLTVGPANTDSM
jgi:NADPH:quinone reductase-like Zn-dependent oxidoreductase